MKWASAIAAVSVLFISSTPVYAEDLRVCVISSVEGNVSYLRRDGRAQSITPSMRIEHSDRIVTGKKTRVHLTCDDDATVTIGAETDIDLGDLLGPKENQGYAARLFEGIAGFILPSSNGERFEVRTPNAVASVRSTAWTVDVAGDKTSVFVRDGLVAVVAQDAGGELGPGNGIDITSGGGPAPVKTWGAKRVVAMNARLGFDWE